jgi:short-subunit dehydrogenase
MKSHNFNHCVIWLTGASSGIGAALAIRLARTDCTLILSARDASKLDKVSAQCHKPPVILPLDVTDQVATQSVIKEIEQRFGRLDIVIFNAGDCLYLDINAFDVTIFEKMMQTNFLSTVYGVAASLPLLKQASEPHIVLMGSSVSYLALPRAEAYGASKAAVKYFGDALRIHLATAKIPVTIVYPGFVKTPLTAKNNFPMPFAVSAEQAAEVIFKGLLKYKPEIRFPGSLLFMLRALNLLPLSWKVRLLKRMVDSK